MASNIQDKMDAMAEIVALLNKHGEPEWALHFSRPLEVARQMPTNRQRKKYLKRIAKNMPTGHGGVGDIYFARNGEVLREDSGRLHENLDTFFDYRWPTALWVLILVLPLVLAMGRLFILPGFAKYYNLHHYSTWVCDVEYTSQDDLSSDPRPALGVESSNCESFVIMKTVDGKSFDVIRDEVKPGHTYEVQIGDMQIWPSPTTAQKFEKLT